MGGKLIGAEKGFASTRLLLSLDEVPSCEGREIVCRKVCHFVFVIVTMYKQFLAVSLYLANTHDYVCCYLELSLIVIVMITTNIDCDAALLRWVLSVKFLRRT